MKGNEDDGRSLRVELVAALMLDGWEDVQAIDVVYGLGRTVVWLPYCQAREVVQAQTRTLYQRTLLDLL